MSAERNTIKFRNRGAIHATQLRVPFRIGFGSNENDITGPLDPDVVILMHMNRDKLVSTGSCLVVHASILWWETAM
jgi:hypothetical protein